MKHDWFEDSSYIQDDESNIFKVELCKKCLAIKYWWSDIRDGKIVEHYYIMDGATQYGHNHKCSGELNKNNGIHAHIVIIDEAKHITDKNFNQLELF